MDQSVKIAGTEGKVDGYFCQLPPLNENTVILSIDLFWFNNVDPDEMLLCAAFHLSTHLGVSQIQRVNK